MVERHIIIGDVHGCLRELDLLLEGILPQPQDQVIFVGDLVDKGPEVRLADLSSKLRRELGVLVRTRHVDAESGNMISLGKENPEDPFWADVYDGRFGRVVFGHAPQGQVAFGSGPPQFIPQQAEYPHAVGIDLGCVFGGALAALVLRSDAGEELHMVQSSGKFAQHFDEREQ